MDRLGDDKGCRDVGGGVQTGIQSGGGSCRDVAFIMEECGQEILEAGDRNYMKPHRQHHPARQEMNYIQYVPWRHRKIHPPLVNPYERQAFITAHLSAVQFSIRLTVRSAITGSYQGRDSQGSSRPCLIPFSAGLYLQASRLHVR